MKKDKFLVWSPRVFSVGGGGRLKTVKWESPLNFTMVSVDLVPLDLVGYKWLDVFFL